MCLPDCTAVLDSSQAVVCGFSAPPAGNTGAQITDGSFLILDWLRGTLHVDSVAVGLEIVSQLVGGVSDVGKGWRGYSESGICFGGGGRVAWDFGRPDMGVHLDLSASAVAEFFRMHGGDVLGVLRFLRDIGFKFGRIDFALDDRAGLLSMDTMGRHLVDGRVSSRWKPRTWTRIQALRGPGDTIMMGSRASDACVRIYDKAAEQGLEGSHWVRVELELKRDRAHAAVEALLAGGVGSILGVLRGYLEFKESTEGENVSRRPAASWWVAFLQAAESARLVVPEVVRSLRRVRDWLRRQVAPSLALIAISEGGEVDWLHALLRQGRGRLKPQQMMLLGY